MTYSDRNKYFSTLKKAQKFANKKREEGYKTRITESMEKAWRVDYGASLSFGSQQEDTRREILGGIENGNRN